jgi:hypothetical protein
MRDLGISNCLEWISEYEMSPGPSTLFFFGFSYMKHTNNASLKILVFHDLCLLILLVYILCKLKLHSSLVKLEYLKNKQLIRHYIKEPMGNFVIEEFCYNFLQYNIRGKQIRNQGNVKVHQLW